VTPRHQNENQNLRGGAAPGLAAGPVPSTPRQVRTAALLMYAGAVLGAIGPLYYGLTTSPSTAPQSWHGGNPASSAYAAGFISGAVLFAAVVAGLWLWMAWKVRRGRNWARIVSAVLFGLDALLLLARLVSNPASVVTLSWALSWLAGLGAIILLFRRSASAFFAPAGRSPNPPSYPAGLGYRGRSGCPPPEGQAAQPPRHDQEP
jgi:asparagine N-glycosylation enzyme membrane subunit Stt3